MASAAAHAKVAFIMNPKRRGGGRKLVRLQPMATPETDPTNNEPLSSELQPGVAPRPRVLIVDDDMRTLRVFRRVLLQTDEHCMALEHAADVAAVLRDHPSIEVVISDLRLPETDGIELIRQIRAQFSEQRGIQFILVSGHVSMESAVNALRLEAVDFLFKPVMPRDLLASVHKAMLKTQLFKATLVNRARHSDSSLTLSAEALIIDLAQAAAFEWRPAPGRAGEPRDYLPHYGQEYDSLRFLKRLHEARVRLFGEALLPDPAWGILAELMRAALTGRRVAVTALCLASKAPFTTALRRIDDLVEAGLAARMRDPSDRRRSYIELTDTGHQKMQRYLRNVAVSLTRSR